MLPSDHINLTARLRVDISVTYVCASHQHRLCDRAERAMQTEFGSRLQDRIEVHARITKSAQIAP